MWFIGVEVEQETSAPPPKKSPGSASVYIHQALEEYFTSCTIKTLFCKREPGRDKGL